MSRSLNSKQVLPRLGGQVVVDDHGSQGVVCGADVGDDHIEAVEQGGDLFALAAHLVVQEGVLRLGCLQARVELGLVRGEGGVEVRGEDGFWGKEVGAVKGLAAGWFEGKGEVTVLAERLGRWIPLRRGGRRHR